MAAAAARAPRTTFPHQKTVCLMIEEGMDLDAVQIANSLADFGEDIIDVVPKFGGKCFDITMLRPV